MGKHEQIIKLNNTQGELLSLDGKSLLVAFFIAFLLTGWEYILEWNKTAVLILLSLHSVK